MNTYNAVTNIYVVLFNFAMKFYTNLEKYYFQKKREKSFFISGTIPCLYEI